MPADDYATQWARTSAATVLTMFRRYILSSVTEDMIKTNRNI